MDMLETDDLLSSIGTSYFTDLTHPPTLNFDHSDWDTFSRGLVSTLDCTFSQNSIQYVSTHALLLNWADDDLGTDTELCDLDAQLKSQFNLTTEIWKIPSNDAEEELANKLFQVKAEHGGDGKLLIVYYGGHGVWDQNLSIWAANVKDDSPTLVWSGLQRMLMRPSYDVLIVLDCCYAGSAGREKLKGTKELLAACGMEVEAEGVSAYSFTRNLIHKLQSFGFQPFTVNELYERLLKAKRRLRNTPHYVPLSGRGRPSIYLVPTPPPIQSSYSSDQEPLFSLDAASIMPSSDSYPRVLLAISFKEESTIPNLDSWTRWLSSEAPQEILKIGVRVEHAFPSNSTLLLVSMPIRVWCHLPDTTAYRFVDFITGENLLTRLPADDQIQEQPVASLTAKTEDLLMLIQSSDDVPKISSNLYQSEKIPDKEETRLRQNLRTNEIELSCVYLKTLGNVSNLAFYLVGNGRYDEAERLNQEVLVGRERVLGPDHPYTLTSVTNLAFVYLRQGKYLEAEKLSRRAAEGREKKLGPHHPQTLTSLTSLAFAFLSQTKYSEAEQVFRRVLSERQITLSLDHPDSLKSADYLAWVLQVQDKCESAEEIYRLTLERRENTLGLLHPDTLKSAGNLAWVLEKSGKFEEIEKMHQRAQDAVQNVKAPEDPKLE